MLAEGERAYQGKLGEVAYSAGVGGTPAQTSNAEINALSDKASRIGLTVPEQLRLAELSVEGYRRPDGTLPPWAQAQLDAPRTALERLRQDYGYYDTFK
jgi:hypothetical protein